MLAHRLAALTARLRRHPLRAVLLLVAVVGLVHAARQVGAARREVVLVYERVPAGPFEVEVRDADGALVRRAAFAAGAERTHPMQLAEGRYAVHLRVGSAAPSAYPIAVQGDAAIAVRWRP